MKKLKLLALAFVISTTSLFATTVEVPDIPVKQIRSQVADLFTNPDFSIENDMTVNVLFTFNSEGEIVVLRIDSKDSDIIDYVHKSMNTKKLDVPGELNRVFKLPLKIESN